MRRYGKWSDNTRTAHGAPCAGCGTITYSVKGVCRDCSKQNWALANVKALPEDYLMRCAEELLRRHARRAETLAKLGIGKEAA